MNRALSLLGLLVLLLGVAPSGWSQVFDGFVLGDAISTFEPETIEVNGQLILPPPLDPSTYVVGNRYDDAIPDSEGFFNLDVVREGVTVTAAVPQTYEEGENVWLSVYCCLSSPTATRGPATPELIIDAGSTARGIVLMHPFFLTPDPYKLEQVEATVTLLPSISTLTQGVLDTYPSNSTPFDDTTFFDQYTAAMIETLDSLPSSGVEDINQVSSGRSFVSLQAGRQQPRTDTRAQIIRSSDPRTQVQQLDGIRELLWSSPKSDTVAIQADIGMPLDSIVTLRRIDPHATHDLYEGDNDVGDFRYHSLFDVTHTRNQPPEFLFFSLENDDEQILAAPARSLFKYVDIFGLVMDFVFSSLGLGDDPEAFTIDPTVDALYEIRGLNGRFASGVDMGEFDFAWNNYREEFSLALTLNLLNGVLDFVAVFVDLNDLIGECVPKLVLDISLSVTSNVGTQVASELTPEDIAPLIGAAAKTGVTSVLDCGRAQLAENLAKKPLKGLMSVGKTLLKTIDILGKVSKVGSLWDRVSTLTGFPGTISAVFISPMTSGVLIVGDPYSPAILSVHGVDPDAPGSPLSTVTNGTTITITGRRFQQEGDTALPKVTITDGKGRQKQVNVKSGDFTPGGRGMDPLQTIMVQIPEGISGKLKFAVSNNTNVTSTDQILEILPTLSSIKMEFAFPSLGVGSVRLNGDGFDPDNHRVVLSKSGSADIVLTPLSTGVISTVQTLFFQFTGSPDPGTYDVAVRWRDPSEDAVGDPALKFTVLGPPVIDTVSPTTARPLQIIKLDGKNFGTEASQITVNFVDIASSVTTGNNPVRVDVTEVVGDDQVGFLWARPDLSYIDPVPGTEEKEDMTVQVTVTTPEGTSAPSTFTISEEAEPEFSRELTFPALTLQEMIDYANQDPAPVGEIMAMIVCDVPATCMGSPSMNGRCGYTYPESWIPEPNPLGGDDIGTNGVSLPPGRPAAPGSACNPCDLTGPLGCTEVEGPISWEDIPADNIADNLVFRPEADSPGDIDLSSVTPGTALKGPDVVLDFTPLDGNPNGKIIGGGFVIEGDGKDSTRLRITSKGTMTVDPAEGTVITITDAHDVELNIDINGAPADVGVHIIRSRNIRISGKIKNCVDGIIIEDSENCNIALEVVGCETGITIDGGGLHFVRDTSVGYEFDSMTSTFTVPEGQVVGVVLEGGTAGNEITLIDVVGMQTGIQLDACEDNIIIPQAIGVVINPLASAIQVVDAVGASLSNDVGILLNEGATNNTIRGFGVFGIPTPLGNNDIGILIDGGDDNFLGNLRIGYNNDPGRISDPEDGIGNNMGMVLRGDSDGNTIIGNAFGGNVMFGLVVEPVTGTNNIEQNFFGTVPGLFGAEDLDPNGMAAMAFQSVSDIQTVQRNTFRGETVGISVDDSRDLIFTANTFSEIDEIGIALSMSQNLSFTKDFICGGPFDLLGFCDSTMPDGDVGIVANSSGGLRFSEVVIEGIDGDGIEFDQPPVGGGPTRVEGTVDQGSIIADPIRENPFDALNEPPNERVTGGSAVVITKNTGNGIVIRDGASDIGLIGLSIIENGGNGVLMDNAGANISIEESEITMNDQVGISVNNTDAGSTTIGSPGRGNTINENAFGGIFIISSSQATVQGNFIGSNGDPSGHGIRIFDSHDLLIGGLGGNEPNLISGNGLDGIRVTGPPDGVSEPILIQGNFIGTDETGATAMANSGSGIYINDCGSPTLATIEIDSNLIAGNSDRGITVSNCGSATRVVMEGNIIGRSLPPGGGGAGITGVSNSGSGVAIDDADQVRVTGNSVGFNGSTGITISDSSATVIHDNFIDANTGRGLLIDAQSKDSSVDSNIITGHSGDGIRVANLSRRNRLTRNSIYSNGGEAINLVSGGNSSIVAPNLSAINKDKTRYNISGRIPSNVPDGSRVELFASDDDEAQYFLGESFTLNNLFSFYNVPPPTGVSLDGKTFRATVTDLAGNTSELGELGDPLPPFVPPFCLPSELDDFNFIVASVNNGEINLTNVSNCDTITTWTENLAVDSAPSVRQVSDTRLLVFSSDRDTGGTTDELYLDDGGSSLTRLTDNTIDDLYPTISPDGTQLLYSAEIEAGNFEIQSLPITGGTPTRLTTNPSLDTTPVWHPDGERFYFVSSRDGNPAIYSQTLTDAAIPLPPTKLTSLAGTVGEPDVSPDGSMIAFQYTPPSALGAQVGLLDLNTIEVRLLETGGRTDLSPVWFETTSGELFLITASSPTIQTVPTQLYLLTTDGYPLAVLTDTDGGHTAPSCCWNGFDLTP